ncbi:AraC family transcriptional regulator [Marinicrinis lubricantis]|uniref:AraC family ligand binding domain-containing protein n=1 Tax=Marinicrinis lubricantis TaxID=2086470 RepID=A0ABW1IVN4_9BACL
MHKQSYTVALNPYAIENSDLAVLFSGESQTKPNHKIGPRVYDYYLIHYVLSGRGILTSEGKTYRLKSGDCFIIHPEQLISYESDAEDPWKYRWVAFQGKAARAFIEKVGLHQSSPVLSTEGNPAVPKLFQDIRHAFQQKAHLSELLPVGYLYLLASHLKEALIPYGEAEEAASHHVLVKQMVHYLSTQFGSPVSIEKMAEDLGYHRAYLSRTFKKITGLSPSSFLLKLRIDKGRQLLRERQDLTVEQVAYSVGFTDPLHFSRQFKRMYSVSPTQYRESFNQV